MAMTIAVTRNVPDRFNGFINSCMHEIAPGVYVAPRMKKSVRERLWKVMMDWSELISEDGGVVLFWRSRKAPSGLGVRVIGWPKKELVEYEGMCWEIDEFHGDNAGLVVAEIELENEEQSFAKPPWLGEEVSQDPRYLNINLSQHPYCQW